MSAPLWLTALFAAASGDAEALAMLHARIGEVMYAPRGDEGMTLVAMETEVSEANGPESIAERLQHLDNIAEQRRLERAEPRSDRQILRSWELEVEAKAVKEVAAVRAVDSSYPSTNFMSSCMAEEQHGWPAFNTRSELEESNWAVYFEAVYGEIPNKGFPICTFDFWFIYKDKFDSAGLTDSQESMSSEFIQSQWRNTKLVPAGTLYEKLTRAQVGWWLRHTVTRAERPYAGDSTWIEVRHNAYGDDGELNEMWFLFTPGTGIWFNTGKTALFDDEDSAELDLCGPRPDNYVRMEVPRTARMTPCARSKGLDSVQFVKDYGQQEYLELLSTRLNGLYNCGQEGGGRLPDFIKAGWMASKPCDCVPVDQLPNEPPLTEIRYTQAAFLNCQL